MGGRIAPGGGGRTPLGGGGGPLAPVPGGPRGGGTAGPRCWGGGGGGGRPVTEWQYQSNNIENILTNHNCKDKKGIKTFVKITLCPMERQLM